MTKINEFLEKASTISMEEIEKISLTAVQENKIPKIIHFSFFNWKELTLKEPEYIPLLETWLSILEPKGYVFINWCSNNLPINNFCQIALNNKKWAFAADYARIYGLYNYGGIWMDCDVAVYKNFDDLLDLPYIIDCEYSMFTTFDKRPRIEAGIMGCRKNWDFFKGILESYDVFTLNYINYGEFVLPFYINKITKKNGYEIKYNYGDMEKYREWFQNTENNNNVIITLDSNYFSKTEMDLPYRAINIRMENIISHHSECAYTSHQLFDKWC